MLKVSIVGVPMDLGQTRRGVDKGPSAMRDAGLIEHLTRLNIDVQDVGDVEIAKSKKKQPTNEKLRNAQAVIDANEKLAMQVAKIVSQGRFPLVLGGDHSIAIGTIAGLSTHYNNLGVIWYDAHGDLNSVETSPTGNIHGMALAASMGIGDVGLTRLLGESPKVRPEHIVIIGARSLDEGEKAIIKSLGMKVYTMHEIDRIGMTTVIEETIAYLQNKTDGIHLSLDLDALDPVDAPGVGTPVIGGISYRESRLVMEMLAETNLITSAEFVEVNPILDDKNKTAALAVALIGSLLGEKLL